MEIQNSFSKGLNKDLSPALHSPDSYFDLHNMRLVTKAGLSTGVPENIKGNLLKIIIPDCVNTILIQGLTSFDTLTYSLQINAVSGINFSYIEGWENTLCTQINSIFPNLIKAVYKENRIVIYALDPSIVSITANISGGASGTFNVQENTPFRSKDDLSIIGWEVIRDDIYLLTADIQEIYSQIWRVQYNKISLSTSISLVYTGKLNLSINFPIANPGAIVGNYEGTQIQKLYWTDFNNKPRGANMADPNLMALDSSLIDLQSLSTFSIPILQEIKQDGHLKTGLIQYAYQLSKSTGQQTVISQCSSLIPINSNSEVTSGYINYTGVTAGVSANKSIRIKIDNLDTNYEFIDIIALYYNSGNPSIQPDIEIVGKNIVIPTSGIVEFTHVGNEVGIPITLEEFNIINPVILKAKTISAKNNFLFLGNIKESIFDVNYDARAYRFQSQKPGPAIATIIDKTGTSITVNTSTWDVPEEFDCINPNQDPNSIGLNITLNNPYIYQSDGFTFGGEGLNIKYSFVSEQTVLDNITKSSNSNGAYSVAPSVQVNRQNNSFSFDNYTRVNNTFDDFHSPYIEAQLKGYTRGEVYRFGIVFFDTNGNQSYVKWIGDIEMPHAYMPDPNYPGDASRKRLTFPLTSFPNDETTLGNNLGIRFEVSNVPSGVSGFSIVRCERKSEDKTVLGQGIFQVAYTDLNSTYLVDDGTATNNLGSSPWNTTTPNNAFQYDDKIFIDGQAASVFIPEHLFGTENFTYNSGDQVELIAKAKGKTTLTPFRASYDHAATNTGCGFALSFTKNIYFTKNYEYSDLLFDVKFPQLSSQPGIYAGYLNINNTKTIEQWTSSPTPIIQFGVDVFNLSPSRVTGSSSLNQHQNHLSQGIKTLLIGDNSSIRSLNRFKSYGNTNPRSVQDQVTPSPGYLPSNPTNIYICNYKRLSQNQYGGNSFGQRSENEYISTGHYQPVTLNNTQKYTFTVLGGDTYVSIFDLMLRKRHFSHDAWENYSDVELSPYHFDTDPGRKTSPASACIRYFPVETTVNIDLRQTQGTIDYVCTSGGAVPNVAVPNKTNFDDMESPNVPGPHPDIEDEFIYNNIYSRENSIRKFFPKPFLFLSDGTYDTRVRSSQQKENNEQIDSWSIFKLADKIDLDTIQGPLTNLIVHQDRLIGVQEKGVSVLSVKERSLLTGDNSGATLVLGTGDVLARYDYISKIIGSRHQFSFTQSQDSVFFFDINTKSLVKLQGNSPINLSIAKGLSGFFRENLLGEIQIADNPYLDKGITATYDFKYNEALFTFRDKITYQDMEGVPYNFTVSYNDFIDAFQGFYFDSTKMFGIQPKVYINDKKNIFSTSTSRDLYLHDVNDYGVFYSPDNSLIQPSKITLLVNQEPSITKVFDNFQLVTEVDLNGVDQPLDTFNKIRVYTSNQDTGYQDIPGTTKIIGKRVERSWNISGLRSRSIFNTQGIQTGVSLTDPSFAERLRDKYAFVELVYDNLQNNHLVLNTFKSLIRISPR